MVWNTQAFFENYLEESSKEEEIGLMRKNIRIILLILLLSFLVSGCGIGLEVNGKKYTFKDYFKDSDDLGCFPKTTMDVQGTSDNAQEGHGPRGWSTSADESEVNKLNNTPDVQGTSDNVQWNKNGLFEYDNLLSDEEFEDQVVLYDACDIKDVVSGHDILSRLYCVSTGILYGYGIDDLDTMYLYRDGICWTSIPYILTNFTYSNSAESLLSKKYAKGEDISINLRDRDLADYPIIVSIRPTWISNTNSMKGLRVVVRGYEIDAIDMEADLSKKEFIRQLYVDILGYLVGGSAADWAESYINSLTNIWHGNKTYRVSGHDDSTIDYINIVVGDLSGSYDYAISADIVFKENSKVTDILDKVGYAEDYWNKDNVVLCRYDGFKDFEKFVIFPKKGDHVGDITKDLNELYTGYRVDLDNFHVVDYRDNKDIHSDGLRNLKLNYNIYDGDEYKGSMTVYESLCKFWKPDVVDYEDWLDRAIDLVVVNGKDGDFSVGSFDDEHISIEPKPKW